MLHVQTHPVIISDTQLKTHLAPNWTLDWGLAGGSPCWRGQSPRWWRMWPGELVRCTPGQLRRELLALVQRQTQKYNYCFKGNINSRKNKKLWYKSQVSTFIFVEYCESGGGAVGVPQSHSPVCRAGEEALVCAAVHQTPNRVSVSTQFSTQHRWICHRKKNHSQLRNSDFKILIFKKNNNMTLSP